MTRLLAILRLIRLPNTLTAAADVIAGAAIVGGDPLSLPVLCAASGSALIYGGGIALNDVLDVEKDRVEAPDRVLPSGQLTFRFAALLSVLLIGIGAATGLGASTAHFTVTLALVGAVVLYDTLPEGPRIRASLVMGSCRALNLARGMTIASGALSINPAGIAILAHLALIIMVTVVSTFERSSRRGATYRIALLGMPVCYLVPALSGSWIALVGGIALGAWVTLPGYRGEGRPILVVKRAIFTLVLFDALYAIGAGHWLAAAILSGLLPLIYGLARAIGQRGS